MDTQLLKQLLSKDFYNENKKLLNRSLFDDDILELYEVLQTSHEKFNTDLTTDTLYLLWEAENPVATAATKRSMQDTIRHIADEDPIDSQVASHLLHGLWQRKFGQDVANIGIQLAEGKASAYDKLKRLIEKGDAGFLPTDFGEDTTTDIHKLLELTSQANKFRFNIPSLCRKVYGIGRQDFMIDFARPETGKTTFNVSLVAGPGGFAEQGLRCGILGNEEATEKTMLRVFQSYCGMTEDEIRAAPDLAKERYQLVEDKITLKNIFGWSLPEVEAYVTHKQLDVVVVDQADKVGIDGSFASTHEKLRALYTGLREGAKRTNSAWIAVSQASNDAEGKTQLTPDMMEGSKTGKYAEADLIIGIGKYKEQQDEDEDPTRYLTIGKNKLSGWHGTIPVKLEKTIARYVD